MHRSHKGEPQCEVVGRTLDGVGRPVIALALSEPPGWEVVVTVSSEQTVRAFTLQPLGTFAASWLDGAEPADDPALDVTARRLRSLPFGAITAAAVAEARQWMADSQQQREWLGPSGWVEGDRQVDEWAGALGRRPGRRGRPDSEYLALVLAYLDRVAEGDPQPIATLASRLHLARGTVSQLLYAARNDRGLLTAGPRGRPGGQLTEKARALLAAEKEGDHGQR